jgi:hypothetical protein
MHRRTFLAALAAIPGLRWLKPEPTPTPTPAIKISKVGGVPIRIVPAAEPVARYLVAEHDSAIDGPCEPGLFTFTSDGRVLNERGEPARGWRVSRRDHL